MFWCAKSKAGAGSLLIEAVVAVAVLAVGLVTVMQSYAAARRSVTMSGEYTRLLSRASSILGGIYVDLPVSEGAAWKEEGPVLEEVPELIEGSVLVRDDEYLPAPVIMIATYRKKE
ncbi:MAG: hypothetical protein GX606_06705 [Elusimicrobia bacterium]|nr:hypothetical protein [Elusimicrobiota bacterium]